VNRTQESSPGIEELRGQVTQLGEMLRVLEEQRDRLSRRRRRRLLILGLGVSVVVHLVLMYYLASQYRQRPSGWGTQPASYEFAILQEEQLTEFESTELNDLVADAIADRDELSLEDPAAELDPAAPAAELELALSGSMPTLGGSGDRFPGGLVAGGAGTSFFGVGSRGMRFAYIVDRSGSMQGRKIDVAMKELARSIAALPDYAHFYIVLFSTGFIEPPMQQGWMRARRTAVHTLIQWLNQIDPSGGTEPIPAFQQVFALPERPDVIFFLTDGEIPNADETGSVVADLNRRGGRVIINTIAFGDARSKELLRRIAKESGGVYRFVSTEDE